MTTTKIKRSAVLTYMWTDPPTNTVFSLIGDGVVSAKITMKPKTTEEQYINEDSARVSIDSYSPSLPVEMTCKVGDPVFEYIDDLRIDRAVLDDAETYIFNVWNYKAGGPTAAPAEKQKVAIAVEDFGEAGGVPVKLNYTIYFIGDPIPGTFNITTPAFTPS